MAKLTKINIDGVDYTAPTKTSDLTNDNGFVTATYHDSSKQDKLTAGANITISEDNVISATGGGGNAVWGQIAGTLSEQTDLQDELNKKQNKLTAGRYISISDSSMIDTVDVLTTNSDQTLDMCVKTFTGSGSNYYPIVIYNGVGSNYKLKMNSEGILIKNPNREDTEYDCNINSDGITFWDHNVTDGIYQVKYYKKFNLSYKDSATGVSHNKFLMFPELSSWNLDDEYIALASQIPTVPTNVSAFTNDAGYVTDSALEGYATTSYVDNHHDSTKQDVIDDEHKLDYSLLENTPDIPSIEGLATESYVDNHHDETKQDVIDDEHKLDYSFLDNTPEIPTVPTDVSAFNNDADYATNTEVSTAISNQTKETWTFTLSDGSTVTKTVVLGE